VFTRSSYGLRRRETIWQIRGMARLTRRQAGEGPTLLCFLLDAAQPRGVSTEYPSARTRPKFRPRTAPIRFLSPVVRSSRARPASAPRRQRIPQGRSVAPHRSASGHGQQLPHRPASTSRVSE